MSLVYPHDFSSKSVLDKDELQAQFDAISAKFDGGIVDADISSNATIGASKVGTLSGTTNHEVTIHVGPHASGWPDTGELIGACPLPDGSTYTVTAVRAVMKGVVSTPTVSIKLDWSYINTSGVLTQQTEILSSLSLAQINSTEYARNDSTGLSVALDSVTTEPGFIALLSNSNADATILDDNDEFLAVTISMTRSFTI